MSKRDKLQDPEVLFFKYAIGVLNVQGCKCCFVSVQIRNRWEILSGQHRTNAMDEFVNGVKAIEQEWVSVLGRTLSPVFTERCL